MKYKFNKKTVLINLGGSIFFPDKIDADYVKKFDKLVRELIKKGMEVIAGQKIGEVGSTGASTGPHLHWEVRISGAAQDPQDFLESRKKL